MCWRKCPCLENNVQFVVVLRPVAQRNRILSLFPGCAQMCRVSDWKTWGADQTRCYSPRDFQDKWNFSRNVTCQSLPSHTKALKVQIFMDEASWVISLLVLKWVPFFFVVWRTFSIPTNSTLLLPPAAQRGPAQTAPTDPFSVPRVGCASLASRT